jgi:hypothetical protein
MEWIEPNSIKFYTDGSIMAEAIKCFYFIEGRFIEGSFGNQNHS